MLQSIRKHIKSTTGRNVWIRYAFLAPWRLLYAFFSLINQTNVAGNHPESECAHSIAVRTFNNYKLWGGIGRFHGRVAEVGPGDVGEIAEMFLADGCSQVDQIERFAYENNSSHPAVRLFRQPAEKFFLDHHGYEFIVSSVVMEHVYDPLGAIRAMARALAPGGLMIHAVDCRDHGQFSDSLHDLSFLRIPPVLYKPLTLASGLNRVRLSDYTKALDELGLQYSILVVRLSGASADIEPPMPFELIPEELLTAARNHVAKIRPKLARKFREMPEEDLLVAAFVLVAKS
ncbi:MAG TPA: methyltransferase domain-containing protein [Candidatus Angelobacter sp.]|nr:methyltransferase domain-containing protein [Candidatus Angelobacter sp.]